MMRLFLTLASAMSLLASAMRATGRADTRDLAVVSDRETVVSDREDANNTQGHDSGCGLPLPMGPEHFANSVEQAMEGAVQWYTLQCLMQRAEQVGGDDSQYMEQKKKARRLVRQIWTLHAQKDGAFGMTGDQFAKTLMEKASYGVTLSELMFDMHANDAIWELMTLLPEIRDLDQMEGRAGFDYRTVAEICRERAPREAIEMYVNKSMEELAAGCSGDCTKVPGKKHTCGPSESQACPEGTSCLCKKEFSKWAPAVFVGSYITIFAIEGLISPKVLAVAPVDPWAIAITSLTAMRYTGCLCVPNVCKYSSDDDACGILPHNGNTSAMEPGYPTLPYLGTKCARDPNLPNEKKCYVQRCTADDISAGALGRVGTDVFNCHDDFWKDFAYVPQKERFAIYDEKVDKAALGLTYRSTWQKIVDYMTPGSG
eukprot:TRINITY_DN74228_c0_g1_i1.p1 TRINITY_DN74228_c0_g1~~TRINITY_DN74228_c0_g1_i1.p1  ORF type:complete len:428 (-),score=60.64 TRINITY_DN74228_c0_g1_i1:88-1371(-)